jgi:hypothetical protein
MFLLSIAEFLAKHSYQVTHSVEVGCLLGRVDAALEKDLLQWRGNGKASTEWWAERKHYAHLVLPSADVELCLQPGKEASQLIEPLQRVHDSSCVGQKLVWRALRDAKQDSWGKLVVEAISTLHGKKLDVAAMELAKQTFKDLCCKHDIDPHETYKAKEKPVEYLGFQLMVPCSSLMDEFAVNAQAYVRQRALDSGALKGIYCEMQLAAPNRKKEMMEVDASLVSASKAARAAFVQAMEGHDPTAHAITKKLTQKASFLASIDRNFNRIEAKFFHSNSGSMGLERVQNIMLSYLPSAEHAANPHTGLGEDGHAPGWQALGVRGPGREEHVQQRPGLAARRKGGQDSRLPWLGDCLQPDVEAGAALLRDVRGAGGWREATRAERPAGGGGQLQDGGAAREQQEGGGVFGRLGLAQHLRLRAVEGAAGQGEGLARAGGQGCRPRGCSSCCFFGRPAEACACCC